MNPTSALRELQKGGLGEGEQPQLIKHTFCYTVEHTQVYLKHLKKE